MNFNVNLALNYHKTLTSPPRGKFARRVESVGSTMIFPERRVLRHVVLDDKLRTIRRGRVSTVKAEVVGEAIVVVVQLEA